MVWRYYDLRKSAGYEKWTKGEGDIVIELEKVNYKTEYPYKFTIDNFLGGQSSTNFSKTRREAIIKINKYKRTH